MSDQLITLGALVNVDRPVLTPKKIVLPSEPGKSDDRTVQKMFNEWYSALRSYAEHMQQYGTVVDVVGWEDMYRFGQTITDTVVDGFHVAFDYSDYENLTPYSDQFDAVMTKTCTLCQEQYLKVGSASYLLYDWPQVQRLMSLRDEVPISSEGYIQYQATVGSDKDRPRVHSRRSYVVDLLQHAFGKRLHRQAFMPREEHLRDAAGAVACVHIGGSFPGAVDRTTSEVMMMGRCLVQNDITSLYGGIRPITGVHYLACRDDYSDLVQILKRLLDDPGQAVSIGAEAYELSKQMAPEPFWSRVLWTCREAKYGLQR